MMYPTLDFLACPVCKYFPLTLRVLKEVKQGIAVDNIPKPFCKTYCGFQRKYIAELTIKVDCIECLSKDILWGLLYCPQCENTYVIFCGVPLMYPSYLWCNSRLKILHKIFIKRTKILNILY